MSAPYYADATVTIHHGDCLDVLRELPDASVDSVVTDPPYNLGFMGQAWDRPASAARKYKTEEHLAANPYGRARAEYGGTSYGQDGAQVGRGFQQWCELWATECLRVLKPGGHLLAFGGTRTSHRLACAIEDAGFEIRDSIAWLYGSGFPKSLDVSKAIDKAARGFPQGGTDPTSTNHGKYRTITTEGKRWDGDSGQSYGAGGSKFLADGAEISLATGHAGSGDAETAPKPQEWQGWGTALKPAHEPIVVARKPLSGTVAANVLTHGTGALNIDGCRIGVSDTDRASVVGREYVSPADRTAYSGFESDGTRKPIAYAPGGRWPANVVLDESQAAALDAQSGDLTSGANPTSRGSDKSREAYGDFLGQEECTPARGADTGGASRFFYTAKASSSERIRLPRADGSAELFAGSIRKRCTRCGKQEVNMPGSACACSEPDFQPDPAMSGHIAHPTVKPLSLMRWLVRLVTPPGGTVLEPFAGSGTTVEACILEGFRCIAIEREADYLPLIVQRANRQRDPIAYTVAAAEDLGLFGTFDFGDAS